MRTRLDSAIQNATAACDQAYRSGVSVAFANDRAISPNWQILISDAINEGRIFYECQRLALLPDKCDLTLEDACEVLARYVDHDGTEVVAGVWIDAVSNNDALMRRLDRYTLEWLAKHYPDGLPRLHAVNFSAQTFGDPSIVPWLRGYFDRNPHIQPEKLAIEATEQAAISQLANTAELIDYLSQLGIEVYLDDFGTGYSSFSLFVNLHGISGLKIDMSFTRALLPGVEPQHQRAARLVIQTIMFLAALAGLSVIAEGIETSDIEAELLEIKARSESAAQLALRLYGQGYGLPDGMPRECR